MSANEKAPFAAGPQDLRDATPKDEPETARKQGPAKSQRRLSGEESIRITRAMDGEISREAMRWQAKRVLLCAARTGRGLQVLWLRKPDGSILEELRMRNGPGGCITMDPQGAGSRLGADLVLAIESLGAGQKVRIGSLVGGAA